MNSREKKRIALLFVALGCGDNVAFAHHSYAMYDQRKQVFIEGTVRTLEWTNPHIWVWVDVDDGKGGRIPYGFEAQAPSELQRFFGWSRTSLKSGDRVRVQYGPLRSGKNGGVLQTITFPDGRKLLTPRSNPSYGLPRGAPEQTGSSR
jgi:hypothetical protein